MTRHVHSALCLLLLVSASAAAAQTVTADPVACIPREANAIATASLAPEIKRSQSVRLYFRRLNPDGGYYWVEMLPAGGGAYTTLLPKPEDQAQQELTDEWWEILRHRDWMGDGRDRDWLADFFENQEYEAVEYYVAVIDAEGGELARDETRLTEVRDRDDCVVGLTRHELGLSQSLVVGETLASQRDRAPYHWLCDGIVSRVDPEDVLRPDALCRACVVAGFAPAAAAAGAVVAATAIEKREPRNVSPVQ